jgi:uncharacterized protein
VRLELEATSWVVPAGHRLRLSLAGTDWPNTWPPPTPTTLTVERGSLTLTLPVVEGPSPITDPPGFVPPVSVDRDEAPSPPPLWRIDHHVLARTTAAVIEHGTAYNARHGASVVEAYAGEVGVDLDDPGRAWASASTRFAITWPEVAAAAEVHLSVRSNADTFDVAVDLDVTADGEPFAIRRWRESIPRRLV